MTRQPLGRHFGLLALVLLLLGPPSGCSGLDGAPGEPKAGGGAAPQSKSRPVITVEAVYPGANAQVVANAVAAPIEQQVNGVEGMAFMASRAINDGSYVLAVTFKPGMDAKRALARMRKRVSLAMPALPEVVRYGGLTIKEAPAGPLLFVKVFSPDRSRDNLFLSRYSAVQLEETLSRVPGVAEVKCIGRRDYAIRVWLDNEKLAARKLTATDVVDALRAQNLEVAPGTKAKAKHPQDKLTLQTLGRLADPEELAGIILKTAPDKAVVYLKDVARVELGAKNADSAAFHGGEQVVLLTVAPTPEARPREVSAAVRKELARLRARLPDGVALKTVFDLAPGRETGKRPAAPEYLLVDVTLPDAASLERICEVLRHSQRVLSELEGVDDTLALSEAPFDPSVFDRFARRSCILVRLAPPAKRQADREKLMQLVRTRLAEAAAGAAFRVRARTTGPAVWAYPIDLIVHGPEAKQVRELADKLAERLRRSEKLVDVRASRDSTPVPQLYVDVDRDVAARAGVSLTDLFNTLQTTLGSVYVNDFNRFGRTWQVVVQAPERPRDAVEDLKRLMVRNRKGEMVPLDKLAKVQTVNDPLVLDRFNGKPAVQLTANPAVGTSIAEARTLCERLADEVRRELRLPAAYRVSWLRDLPASR